MKKYLVFLAAALLQAGAWAVTYTYTGSSYTAPTLTNHAGPGCPIGACGDFTTSMSQYGTFTTVSPLPPNFNGTAHHRFQLQRWTDNLLQRGSKHDADVSHRMD